MKQDNLMAEFLPVYRGSCVNPDCSSGGRQRVLSVDELYATYPASSDLPFTPLPPQASHICDRCGMVYCDYQIGFDHDRTPTYETDDGIDVSEIDWEPGCVFESDLSSAAVDLVEACPDDVTRDELVDVIRRWIPGFGETEAIDVIERAQCDVVAYEASQFM